MQEHFAAGPGRTAAAEGMWCGVADGWRDAWWQEFRTEELNKKVLERFRQTMPDVLERVVIIGSGAVNEVRCR